MNNLKNQSSSYLKLHQYDPIDWHPWSTDAFELALKKDCPIFLSIGFASCHWCHVMQRETFQDSEIANILNQHFVCIKVDREERPDIDHVFMEALIGLNGHGGWPMTLFLTPKGEPFFAGTYFPKLPQPGQMAFIELIGRIMSLWHRHRQDVTAMAAEITLRLSQQDEHVLSSINEFSLEPWFAALNTHFDYEHGGLQGAPKFLQFAFWQGLLAASVYKKDQALMDVCFLTMSRIMSGGTFDQLEGGVFRYATDAAWRQPHFEKMLYDNAQAIEALAVMYGVEQHDFFQHKAEQIMAWMTSELMLDHGCFAAGLNAEVESVEGFNYLWSWDELVNVLGDDVTEAARIFNWKQPEDPFKRTLLPDMNHLQEDPSAEDAYQRIFKTLKQQRALRQLPAQDKLCLLNWHAQLIKSLSRASLLFKKIDWLEMAADLLTACERVFLDDDKAWHHAYGDAGLSDTFFLDDGAELLGAYIYLYAADPDETWLHKADAMWQHMESFWDAAQGCYRLSQTQDAMLIKNPMVIEDIDMPSGNALMACHAAQLYLLTGQAHYQARCEQLLRMGLAQKTPFNMGQWVQAYMWYHHGAVVRAQWLTRPACQIKPYWLMVQSTDGATVSYCTKAGCQADIKTWDDLIKLS